VQGKLISGFDRKRYNKYGKLKPVDDYLKTVQQRITLYQQQLKMTQGMQELELQREEIQFLLKQLEEKKVTFNDKVASNQAEVAQQGLTKQLATVESNILRLQKEKQAQCVSTLKEHTKNVKLPDKAVDFAPTAVTQNALAVQQKRLLEMTAGEEVNASRQKKYAETKKVERPWLADMEKYLAEQQIALNTASKLATGHGIGNETTKGLTQYGDTPLATRGQAQSDLIARLLATVREAKKIPISPDKVDEKSMGEISGSGAVTQKLIADIQHAVQTLLTRQMQANELAKQAGASFKEVQRYMTADPSAETTKYMQDLLKDPTRAKLKLLVDASKDLNELASKITGHKDEGTLSAYLQKLRNVIQNTVVQGPFLLDSKDRLVLQPRGKDDDTDFFELTNSADGDYNDPKNLGKNTYHVTAMANILRAIGSGISVTGLSPGQGGKLGGSCEIADSKRDFSNTGVDIKEGSVVNSQNKVAASSNRSDAMRVYIKQREDHVDSEMKAGKSDAAAKDTAMMLRFPIRAEYLGKFGKDPMHLTANLELLDGTPVPPKDIECLVHGQWIGITDSNFIATFMEMFDIK
jgi:hypothetical protein